MSAAYELIRSDRRTLALEVTADARLVVRAPRRCSQAHITRFVESRAAWIDAHMERQRERLARRPTPDEAEIAALRARAEETLPPLVEYYAGRMGLFPAGVRITGAQKRFGSCSAKNRLCFSYLLLRYPPEAVDYVVVHELAHIAHKNHGKDFYALVASVLPDYKRRDKLLKS